MPIEPCAEALSVSPPTAWRCSGSSSCSAFDDRVLALYRQGHSGSVYTGRGQEGRGPACARADDVVAPLNRELACHASRRDPAAFRNFRATSPIFARRQHAFRCAGERRLPTRLMLGGLVPLSQAPRSPSSAGQPRVAMTFLGEGAFSVGDNRASTSPRSGRCPRSS
jgi:hypothetical protein